MGVFNDIRIDHAKRISELDLDGYAVGGLAVGETHEEMYDVLDNVVPYLPKISRHILWEWEHLPIY